MIFGFISSLQVLHMQILNKFFYEKAVSRCQTIVGNEPIFFLSAYKNRVKFISYQKSLSFISEQCLLEHELVGERICYYGWAMVKAGSSGFFVTGGNAHPY